MVPVPRRRLLKQMALILLATVLGVNLLLLLLATFARLVERLQQLEKWSDWLLMADVSDWTLDDDIYITEEYLYTLPRHFNHFPRPKLFNRQTLLG